MSARIEATGTVKLLDGKAEPDEVVTEADAKDTAKLARLLARLLKDVATLKRRFAPKRIDFEDVAVGQVGTITNLAHKFAGRVRWSVVGWQTTATPTTDNLLCQAGTWMMRGLWGPFALQSNAGDFTVGIRFQATSACLVTGARFLWKASTSTVKVTLWRDSNGAVLGTGTASCVNSGVYTVQFATPVLLSGSDLNVDLTMATRDLAGAKYTNNAADANMVALLPLTLPGFVLKAVDLFLAGDNRPTSATGASQHWIEPLLAPLEPQLVENSASDTNTLSLASYVPGTATIRVEAAG